MAEEWRVSLVIGGGGSTVKGSRYRDLLRARLGDDVAVSAGKMHLFLYAGSAKAADEAGQVAGPRSRSRVSSRRSGSSAGTRPPGSGGTPMKPVNTAGQALARGDLA